jgi:hypothetical protein
LVRLVAAYVIGFVVAGFVVVLLDWPWVTYAVLFVPVALVAEWILLGRRLRAAMEAFSWIGRWEWLRARDVLGRPLPGSQKALRELAAREHDPHPLWVELHAFTGDFDAALREAEALPMATPWQRFERELSVAYVRWVTSGELDDEAARETADELGDPDERLRADAMMSVNEARARLVEGGDWLEPLVALRGRLGSRARGVLRYDWWPARLREAAIVAAVLAVFTIVLD